MRVALVGLGYWGKVILPILKAAESRLGFSIKWVCDHHRENWIKIQKKNPEIIFGEDFNDLFKKQKVDVVFITTQPSSHYSLAMKSLDEGCHVFVEKPFTGDPELATHLKDLASSKSLKIMVGYRLLYSPTIQLIKTKNLQYSSESKIFIEAFWKKWGKYQDIGVHWDLASHYIAVINYLFDCCGEVVSAVTLSESKSGIIEDVVIVLKHRNLLSRIEASWNSSKSMKGINILTAKRLFKVRHDEEYPLIVYDVLSEDVGEIEKVEESSNFEKLEQYHKSEYRENFSIEMMISDFFQSIKTGTKTTSNISNAINVIETLRKVDHFLKK